MADPANHDIYQGDDYAADVTVTLEDGTPADITGYTAQAQVRLAVADVDPVVVATFATDVQSPQVFLSLTHDQTKVMSGRYVWDLQLVDAGGIVTTILYGNVSVKAEVTRVAA